MKTIAIIPARLGSSRLPNKPLLDLQGKPLLQWVYEGAQKCPEFSDIIVATDSERIIRTVEAFGGHAQLTRADHVCGTDRIAEVAERLKCDVVVNLQGDEPFLEPAMIAELVRPFERLDELEMSTLCRPLTTLAEVNNPNHVKVVRDKQGFALYFSRLPIPFVRGGELLDYPHFLHLGLYAYRRDFLLYVAQLPTSELQRAESLEQLKVLEAGHRIFVAETQHETFGVDTPEDLAEARRYAAEHFGG